MFFHISQSYRLNISNQEYHCLEHKVLLTRLNGNWERGDIVAFVLQKDLPLWFKKGQGLMKIAAAIEGDTVIVEPYQVTIITPENKTITYSTDISVVTNHAKIEPLDVVKTFVIPKGQFFALGTKHESYDSKFWGTASVDSIKGVGYGLL
jgi:conjugal transfer pilin signal peptidase TrbI